MTHRSRGYTTPYSCVALEAVTGGAASQYNDAFVFKNTITPTVNDTGRIISSDDSEQEATAVDIVELGSGDRGIVVAGNTSGSLSIDLNLNNTNIPQKAGVASPHSEYAGGSSDGFVALYESISGQSWGADEFSYLGGQGADRITDLQVVNHNRSNAAIFLTGSNQCIAERNIARRIKNGACARTF